jgi:Ca2+:H+ antiporter
LLFLGISALVGGVGRVRQTFSQASAGLLSTLLFVVVVAILLPAVFDLTERVAAPGLIDERLRLRVSVVLLVLLCREPRLHARHPSRCVCRQGAEWGG